MFRCLIGPVTPRFPADKLTADDNFRFFDFAGRLGITLSADCSWDDLVGQLPAGWRPDVLVFHLSQEQMPFRLLQAPIPIVALAPDWNLHWHYYRRILRKCDRVITNERGVELLRREGLEQAFPGNLFGLEANRCSSCDVTERDIDVLYIANVNVSICKRHGLLLARLAQLGVLRKVVIKAEVFGADYQQLLSRAKIVVNYSAHGECNKRVFETIAAGALLLQDSEAKEVTHYLKPLREFVPYDENNLEKKIEHYLECNEERGSIATAANSRLSEFTFHALFAAMLDKIAQGWDGLKERAERRATRPNEVDPAAATWFTRSISDHPQLSRGEEKNESSSVRLMARGIFASSPDEAAAHFDELLQTDPTNSVFGLNRAEALFRAGRHEDAIVQAKASLAHLERSEGFTKAHIDLPHYPNNFDLFRIEWERAAWTHIKNLDEEIAAKRNLVRWRLHGLLAELTQDLGQYYAQAFARPDFPGSLAALGCALGRTGRFAETLQPLHRAVEANPFDRQAARALYYALGDAHDFVGRARFASSQNVLHRSAPELVPLEDWMQNPPPTGCERASVIVVACNQVQFTRLCLESILRHTTGDYELILVDNGSTDATPQLFEEIKSKSGPARVTIIRNQENRGFTRGVNQALDVSSGEFLVMLNNDTIVTHGWLSGLVEWSLYNWPMIGMVGPVSNSAPAPQLVEAGYQKLEEIDKFAHDHRRRLMNRTAEVRRLTGFCLLIRRDVLNAIGGRLDEQFAKGYFEDDDLCMRVLDAGFRLCLAYEVYIHHHGSATFRELGIDVESQLKANFELFRHKWGDEAAAPYRPIGNSSKQSYQGPSNLNFSARPQPGSRPKVSLCMIVRNEERNLADCLRPLRQIVDEIVIVDTGSTDSTKQIALSFGAKLIEITWPDSFAAARNMSLENAHGDWIFWMDADDRIDPDNLVKLQALFGSLDDSNSAYVMKCLCVAQAPGDTVTAVDHVRLFRNDPRHRWKYRVHEQILPSIRSTQGEVRWSDIIVIHTGYADPLLRQQKLDRDLRLLHRQHEEHPDDPFNLFNLGSVYRELNRPQEALQYLCRSLARSHEKDSIVRKLFALIVQCHRELNQAAEAIETCAAGRKIYPDDAELLFLESSLLREHGDASGAEDRLHRLINGRETNHFSSTDAGLRSYKARHHLAVICLEQKRFPEAESHWQAAIQEEPAFFPAHVGLGELYAQSKNWEKLERHAKSLSRFGPKGDEESLYLLGLGKFHAGELSAARFRLNLAVPRYPQSLRLKRLLAQVTLEEGTDLGAAEKILQDILALDPNDEQAKRVINSIAKKLRQTPS